MKHIYILLCCVLLFVISCSSAVDVSITSGGQASFTIKSEIPSAVETKLRPFLTSGSKETPIMNAAAALGVELPKGLRLVQSRNPKPSSYEGELRIDNLNLFISENPDLVDSGAIKLAKTDAWEELTLVFSRKTAKLFVDMFPFLDKELLDALSPPALYDGDISAAEYTKMLGSLFGKKAMTDIENAFISFTIKTPKPILECEGSSKTGPSTAGIKLPVLTCIILEQPITVRIRWQK